MNYERLLVDIEHLHLAFSDLKVRANNIGSIRSKQAVKNAEIKRYIASSFGSLAVAFITIGVFEPAISFLFDTGSEEDPRHPLMMAYAIVIGIMITLFGAAAVIDLD